MTLKIESLITTTWDARSPDDKTTIQGLLRIEENALVVVPYDGGNSIVAPIQNQRHFLMQLTRSYEELKIANLDTDHPEWTERFFEDLGDKATVGIEAFPDSEKRFMLTLTVNVQSNQFWIALEESQVTALLESCA